MGEFVYSGLHSTRGSRHRMPFMPQRLGWSGIKSQNVQQLHERRLSAHLSCSVPTRSCCTELSSSGLKCLGRCWKLVPGEAFSLCQAVRLCGRAGSATRICFVLVKHAALEMWGELKPLRWVHFPCEKKLRTPWSAVGGNCNAENICRSMVKQALFRPLLNKSWSPTRYCFTAILPARERPCSHSSSAPGLAASSVLPWSHLGHGGISALWARLLATNDGLTQNGKADYVLCQQLRMKLIRVPVPPLIEFGKIWSLTQFFPCQ